MSKKLYALIISTEDYVDTTLFDELAKITAAFKAIPYTTDQAHVVVAELDGLEYSFGFGAYGDFYGGQIILENK